MERGVFPHPRKESGIVEGQVLFYCFGQGNTSLFAEKDLGRDPKETKEGGGGGFFPTGADLRAEEGRLAVPARTEGAEKVRPSSLLNAYKGGLCPLLKIWDTKKGRHTGEFPIVPPATERN